LFVIGLNEGVFPRAVGEDPLLSDELRRRMFSVLPDLPIKSRGRAEERFLFEQLLRASPRVTLSWSTAGEDGKALAISPLLARLLIDRARSSSTAPERLPSAMEKLDGVERAPTIFPRRPDARVATAPRPAHEHAVLAASHAPRGAGARANLERVLPSALREVREIAGLEPSAADTAGARIAVLRELDPPLRERRSLGLHFGFVGAAARPSDPRRADLWVTSLERMAVCPWQAFLERVMRVQPAPDPLAALPSIDARIVGIAVHAALARVAHRDGGGELDLEQRLSARPSRAIWPASSELDRVLADVARSVLRAEGFVLPGLERILVEEMLPFLNVARDIDERDATEVLGSEVRGKVAISDGSGGRRALHFRADRVESTASGPRLTDFKTGAPLSKVVDPAKREKDLARAIGRGTHLQAAAYALAAAANARGRYLFLAPKVRAEWRELAVEHGSSALTRAFATSTETLARAWSRGVFFPRLVDATLEKEPAACARCEVSSACSRGDSRARRTLAEWVRARGGEDERRATASESIDPADGSRSIASPASRESIAPNRADDSVESVALALWRLASAGAATDGNGSESAENGAEGA
jgi:hypothetical protein